MWLETGKTISPWNAYGEASEMIQLHFEIQLYALKA